MNSLGQIFSSRTRTEVLRALALLEKPQGIRHLARLTRRGPRSVELALSVMVEEGRIQRIETQEGHPGYMLDHSHEEHDRVQALFETDRRMELRTRAHALNTRATSVSDFMDEGLQLVSAGRKSLHATH